MMQDIFRAKSTRFKGDSAQFPRQSQRVPWTISRRPILWALIGGFGYGSAYSRRAEADTISYTYDQFGRVITATYSSGVTVTYTYDSAGNRTQKVVSSGGGASLSVSLDATEYDWYAIEGTLAGASPSSITATASGGSSPYTYQWLRSSGPTYLTPTATYAATTAWSGSAPLGSSGWEYWYCKITDSASATVNSGTVTVYYENDM